MLFEFFILLVIFQIKHLVADYYLQFPYMYENKGQEKNWVTPLLDHSLVHAGLTFGILAVFGQLAFPDATTIQISVVIGGATILDLVSHFITDRWKAVKRLSPNEAKFWTSLGIDQMIHHLVGIIIVTMVIAVGNQIIIL